MRVSVIIPCHDAEAFLAQTIASALEQTAPPHEIIVVDDASTDDSLRIARATEDERVVVLAERFGNAPAARNRGAELATGDALMFLDADDLLGPSALEALVDALAPDTIARCPWYRLEHHHGQWLTAPPSCAARRADQDDLQAWLTGWYHPPCAILWSRAAFEGVGGWDPAVAVNNDGDIMMRAFLDGVPLLATDRGAGFYRRAKAGVTTISGRRWSREGLASRLGVVLGVAERLEREGRLDGYRAALAEALDALADGGAEHAELVADCRRAARRYGGPRPTRIARRLAGRVRYVSSERSGDDASASRATAGGASTAKAPRGPATPRVTVVIPTYNRAATLPDAIASVLAQSLPDFELLIVDDASTDASPQIVSELDDPRVRLLRQPRNGGAAAARNRGLDEARGELVAFLDSDDEWLPEKLERQVALFDREGVDLGLVYSGIELVDPDGARELVEPRHRGDVYGAMLLENVVYGGGSNAMIRRAAIDRVGGFDEAFPAIEDYDLWLRIARYYRVDFVPEVLARYRTVDTTRVSKDLAKNLAARQRFFEKHRADMLAAKTAQAFLLEGARRHLREDDGDARAGRRLVLAAFAADPTAPRIVPWLPYMLLPHRGRRLLRDIERDVRRWIGAPAAPGTLGAAR